MALMLGYGMYRTFTKYLIILHLRVSINICMESSHFCVCLHLLACISIILILGDKMKELNNSKYLIRDDINSSIISLSQTERQIDTDRHPPKS